MPTSNLTCNWSAPTTGEEVASYRLEGRKGTTGEYVQLAANITPNASDPQTHTLTKQDIDTNLDAPADGDTIQIRALGVGTSGTVGPPSETPGQITVPSA